MSRSRFDNQDKFPALTVSTCLKPGRGLAQAAPMYLFEQFGKFTGDQHLPVDAEHGAQIGKTFGDAMRRLIENQRQAQGIKRVDAPLPGRRFGRQEPGENEAGFALSGHRPGGGQRRGAGNGHDPVTCRAHRGDDAPPWVAQSGSARIADQRDTLAARQAFDNPATGGVFIVPMQSEATAGEAEVR